MQAPVMSSPDDSPTRARVVQVILRRGPSTAADLATELELTAAAVRRHLDQLVIDGAVEAREQRIVGRRGRGRPAKVFALTDIGRGKFSHGYDQLAVEVLEFLQRTVDDEAVAGFARERLAPLTERLTERLSGLSDDEQPRVLAEELTADGYLASVSETTTGTQICQQHCPVAHVAEQFPELCEAETAMFSELLGTHVQRLATIAHGDGVCTTHLPNPVPPQKKVSP